MTDLIQGLGWFLRRTQDPISLAKFYQEALGLPLLRSWCTDEYSGAMMWAGDVCVMETNLINEQPSTTPEQSQCIPVFRTYNLTGSTKRVQKSGAKWIKSENDDRADAEFFYDVDGYPFAIEYVNDNSFFEPDARSFEKWSLGKSTLPNNTFIDGDIQTLSRVIHLTPDPQADLDFLEHRLGLFGLKKQSEGTVITLGETAVLELRQSSVELNRPLERDSVRDTWILREFSHKTLVNRMTGQGDQPIDTLKFDGGNLEYYVTATNRMFGFQERKSFNPHVPATQAIEDIASRALWIEKLSGQP